MTLIIQVANEQQSLPVDTERLREAVEVVLAGEGFEAAEVSVAVVTDPAMHELNRRWLDHDYPTDVLSFVLEEAEHGLEGEIIVSADFAISMARRYGWAASSELLLYVVHGSLHLAGYDDHSDELQTEMRERERHYLALLGVELPRDVSAQWDPAAFVASEVNLSSRGPLQ